MKVASLAAALVVTVVFSFMVGHRQGRGAACFEAAVGTRDGQGRSLRSVLLSRPGAAWDYSFWGPQCTLTIHAPEGTAWIGGRWRFDVSDATLYADDEAALRVHPAAGRWQPSRLR